jgi:hypothetical protein
MEVMTCDLHHLCSGVREIVRVRAPKRHAAIEVIRAILVEMRIKALHHKFKLASRRLMKNIVFLQRRWRRVRIHTHWRRCGCF